MPRNPNGEYSIYYCRAPRALFLSLSLFSSPLSLFRSLFSRSLHPFLSLSPFFLCMSLCSAPLRTAIGVAACVSQYFIEIYIAIYHAARRARQGRRGSAAPTRADVFRAEVFKFSLRLIMSLPLNRRDRKYRERPCYILFLFVPRAGDTLIFT